VDGAEYDRHRNDGEDVIDPDTTVDNILGDNKQQPVEVWFERVPGTLVVGWLPLFVTIAVFRLNTYTFVDQQNGREVGLTLDANSPLDDVRAALREGQNFGEEEIALFSQEGKELNRAVLGKDQRLE
jgi:hypothetical protein